MAIDSLGSSAPNTTKQGRGARILREAILRGDLVPGQRLKQREVAEWLGMSATPVREVMRILEAEGLLVRIPFKGVFVAQVSPEEAAEITPIRVALESLAVRMSVPNLDEHDFARSEELNREIEQAWKAMDLAQVRRANYHFHTALYERCGSDTLCVLIQGLWPRIATDMLWMIPGRTESSLQQHQAILNAARMRDAEAAAELMANHISTAGEAIAQFLRQQSASLPQQSCASAPKGWTGA
jgi:DNA-binding GntR family transcriptional regulator